MNYRSIRAGFSLIALISALALAGFAQEPSTSGPSASSANNSVVPQVVNYSGVLTDVDGKSITNVVGVTFTLYQDEQGGTPLWTEIQNVQPSKSGRYTVMLGSTISTGLPQDVFVSGEARWLGVQLEGQAEQSRVLLVAVPYALKAGDAQTIGGLPASAFMLANGSSPAATGGTKASAPAKSANASKNSPPANPDVTGKGTVDYIPMWDTTSDIIDSIMFQKSSEIGINTTTPAALLDVNGKADVRDTLTLFPKSTDNTLAVSGTSFAIGSAGKVTFITGQTFPGTGTITAITTASGSGLSGGGTSGTLTLKVPSAGITNAMLADSKITLNANTAGGITTPGAMTLGSTYTIGLKTCASKQVLQYNGTSWACAAAGTGTITGISTASGSGLAGGGTSGTLNMSIPAAGVTNTMLKNSSVTLNAGAAGGLTVPGAMTLGDTYTIGLKTCAIHQVLQYNGTTWACAATGTGTVTSVATGTGLTGGPITTSGTLSINTSVVPQLAAANTFSNNQTVSLASNGAGLTVTNSGFGDGVDINDSGGNDGVFVSGVAGDAFVGSATNDGAYLVGGHIGSYAESDTDNGNTGAGGFEFGGTQENMGVYGYSFSTIGIGVYGQAVVASATGANTDSGFYPMGVWGDTGNQFGFGVFGSADDGWAFVGYNNSPSGFQTAWLENQETTSASDGVLFAYGSAFGGTCTIDVSGNVTCSGTISGVAPVAGGSKKVALNAIQSPENWFEDAGSGQLASGEAVVNIESVFGETVNTGVEYHVFLTPNGDCKGLYVAQKSATSFVVKELGGGTSSVAFDYRIMAKRKGFEQFRLVDKTEALSLKHRPVKPEGAASKHIPTAQDVRKQAQKNIKPRSIAENSVPALNKKQ
jgi:hypothetical protein